MHKLSAALAIVMISTTSVHSSPTTPRPTKEQVEALLATLSKKFGEPDTAQIKEKRIKELTKEIASTQSSLAQLRSDPNLLELTKNLSGNDLIKEKEEKLGNLKIELQKALAER